MDIYKNLELARKNKRVSYEKIAAECGLSRMGIHKMFKNRTMTVENMLKIMDVIGVSPNEVFEVETPMGLAVSEPSAAYGHKTVRQKIAEIKKLAAEIEHELS